jgi:hypothetical protein
MILHQFNEIRLFKMTKKVQILEVPNSWHVTSALYKYAFWTCFRIVMRKWTGQCKYIQGLIKTFGEWASIFSSLISHVSLHLYHLYIPTKSK